MYLYGIYGVEINYEKSKKYFELATKRDEPKAFAYLAYQYENGLGVDVDIPKALDLYQSSIHLVRFFFKIYHLI